VRTTIATELGVVYLQRVQSAPQWPVGGTLFGSNYRAFVALQVKKRPQDKAINVIFLVDTACPYVYLSSTAMTALLEGGSGFSDSISAYVHDLYLPSVYVSPASSHFHDINVVGAQFFYIANAKLSIDYSPSATTASKVIITK